MSSLRVFIYVVVVVVVVTRQVLDDNTLDISCHGDPTLLSSSVTRNHCSLFLVSITFETLCFYNDHFITLSVFTIASFLLSVYVSMVSIIICLVVLRHLL